MTGCEREGCQAEAAWAVKITVHAHYARASRRNAATLFVNLCVCDEHFPTSATEIMTPEGKERINRAFLSNGKALPNWNTAVLGKVSLRSPEYRHLLYKLFPPTNRRPPMTETKPAVQLPRWKCHKEVHAIKIMAVLNADAAYGYLLKPAIEGYADIEVTGEWVKKHEPEGGGYYVVYADGYTSFSPAEAFEDGYTPIQ